MLTKISEVESRGAKDNIKGLFLRWDSRKNKRPDLITTSNTPTTGKQGSQVISLDD
jgi:hypothetical protein